MPCCRSVIRARVVVSGDHVPHRPIGSLLIDAEWSGVTRSSWSISPVVWIPCTSLAQPAIADAAGSWDAGTAVGTVSVGRAGAHDDTR